MSKIHKGPSLHDIKTLFSRALTEKTILLDHSSFDDEQLAALARNVDPDLISDHIATSHPTILNNVSWDKMNSRRLCRLMVRMYDADRIDVIDRINTFSLKIKLSDIRVLLGRDIDFLYRFNIDIHSLSDYETYTLLCLGNDIVLEKLRLTGRMFSRSQRYDICKAFKFRRDILEKFESTSFDGFQSKEVLKATGVSNVDILNVSHLKLIDWLDLISSDIAFYELMDPESFYDEPVGQLIDLASLTDDEKIFNTIEERGLSDVSPYGWEKLMVHRKDRFLPYFDIRKMDGHGMATIFKAHPDFQFLKNS
jgi:hypothetical protein